MEGISTLLLDPDFPRYPAMWEEFARLCARPEVAQDLRDYLGIEDSEIAELEDE